MASGCAADGEAGDPGRVAADGDAAGEVAAGHGDAEQHEREGRGEWRAGDAETEPVVVVRGDTSRRSDELRDLVRRERGRGDQCDRVRAACAWVRAPVTCGTGLLGQPVLRGLGLEHPHPVRAQLTVEVVSVAPAGPEWEGRFHHCMRRATSVTYATDSAYAGDDELFRYNSTIAMGHALNRAAFLGVDAEQLAVWDGQPTQTTAGTARDVETWSHSGRATHVIPIAPRSPKAKTRRPPAESAREINAILFSDLRGFSGLRDEHFPIYVRDVLGALAQVLDGHRDALLGYNSWGDAIQAVFSDVPSAARCALDFQDAIGQIDMTDTDLPLDLAMRIGAHVGPVLHLREPFKDELTYWGRELTRAARIEPRTPVGEVYVTDAFAALLALEPASGIRCEYVGRVTTAKDFETIPMYRLRRRGSPSAREPF